MSKIRRNDYEFVVCDYCGFNKTIHVTRQTDLIHKTTNVFFNIVKCKKCGLHFTNPRPNPKAIAKYYPESYSYHNSPSFLKAFAYQLAHYFANSGILVWFFTFIPIIGDKLIEFIKPQIPDPVRKYYSGGGEGAILDIGCGTGFTANFWGTKGAILSYQSIAEIYGVEINPKSRAFLNRKGVNVYADIDSIPTAKKFGVIRMNWSLEHVHAPSLYFQFIKEHLKKNGQAIITVPNYEGLIYKLAADAVELPIHLYHFRPIDIKNYAHKFSFKIVNFLTFSYPSMYSFAAQVGMLPKDFFTKFRLCDARNFQFVLNHFDFAEKGNDMLIVLGHR